MKGYNEGYNDGHSRKDYHNPYKIGSDKYDGFLEGWDLGLEDSFIELE